MTTGKAYGFLCCNATLDEIRMEIPPLRKAVQTPSELELSVGNISAPLQGTEQGIAEKMNEARESGMKYLFEATYPGATNKATADELASVLNQAYQSPLYRDGEAFAGVVVYEEGGHVFIE